MPGYAAIAQTHDKRDAATIAGGAKPPISLVLTPLGAAGGDRPLPLRAEPAFRLLVRNNEAQTSEPLTLLVRGEGTSVENATGWRKEGDALIAEIGRIPPRGEIRRSFRLRVERVPEQGTTSVLVEARREGKVLASVETRLKVADCAGRYRERLAVLREGLLDTVRNRADDMAWADPTLPGSRLFPAIGKPELAETEKLAATIARNRGGDPLLAEERPRFLISRWVSELSAYSRQTAQPGLCAGSSYLIAGHREGLRPITARIETLRAAAAKAADAARAAHAGAADLASAARHAAQRQGLEISDRAEAPLQVLATARTGLARNGKLTPDETEVFSLIETAAWLAEADRRGMALQAAIEAVFAAIASAHKESCVCAF